LVPVLVGAYGLDGYGLLILTRVFLPSGFAIADLGLSETGTIVVARAREAGAWDGASRQLTLLLAVSVAVAVVIGAILLVASPELTTWLHVASEFRPSFVVLVRVTALSLIVFYPALLLEGVVKGYERYTLLRTLDVLSTGAYALGAVFAVRAGYSYVAVAYLFLATNALKSITLVLFALPALRRIHFRFDWGDVESRAAVWERTRLMMHNKILAALQVQLPPLIVGFVVGPGGVGTYDVLTRVPRAVKSVLSLLGAALLPVSARLEESGDHGRIRALGTAGFSMVPAITFPGLMGAAVFAPELLRVWLGPDLVDLWPWLAVMFLVPALNIVLNVGQTMMQVRSRYLQLANRISTIQIATQYAVSLALVPWLRELAFIAGQIAALFITFPLQLRLLLREQGIRMATVVSVLMKHAAIAGALAAALYLVKRTLRVDSPLTLFIWFAVWCAAYAIASFTCTLSQSDRVYMQRMLRAAVGGSSRT
jgi:O-antigen/teichoic acid export membrane protein